MKEIRNGHHEYQKEIREFKVKTQKKELLQKHFEKIEMEKLGTNLTITAMKMESKNEKVKQIVDSFINNNLNIYRKIKRVQKLKLVVVFVYMLLLI